MKKTLTFLIFLALYFFWIFPSGAIAMTNETLPDVLTTEEVAKLVRVDASTIEGLAKNNEIPARKIGSIWRYSKKAILVWLRGVDVAQIAPTKPLISEEYLSSSHNDHIKNSTTKAEEYSQIDGDNDAHSLTAEDLILRAEKIYSKKHHLSIETSLNYTESRDPLSPYFLKDTKATAFNATARYGLGDEFEIFFSIPYVWRKSTTYSEDGVSSIATNGLQETSMGARYVVFNESAIIPEITCQIETFFPLDKGVWGVSVGTTFVKRIDPAVVFVDLRYKINDAEFDEASDINYPEKEMAAAFGYSYALSDSMALQAAISGAYQPGETWLTPEIVEENRTDFFLEFGAAFLVSNDMWLQPTVGFGLNKASTVFMGIMIPYSIN